MPVALTEAFTVCGRVAQANRACSSVLTGAVLWYADVSEAAG